MRTLWMIGLIALSLVGNHTLAQKPGSATGLKAGLKGEYFNGPNFEQKVLTRTDPQVDFDWNWQTPGPGVQREYFSVRWTGKLYAPTSGKYRFSATVDDGVRVWVGGKKVIDEWRKQDDSQFVGEISLNANQLYDLRIEYYNDWKGSIISVFWELPEEKRLFGSTALPRQVVPAKYLFSKPVRPTTAPTTPAIVGYGYRHSLIRSPAPAVAAMTARPMTKRLTTPKTALLKPVSAPVKRTAPVAATPTNPVSKPTPVLAGVVPAAITPAPVIPATEPFATLRAGETVVLRRVAFAQSEYTLLPESYAELNKLVQALKANPALRVKIAGHTDNVGDKRLNQALSEHRAKIVANYLVRHGIAATRITSEGYGGSRPIADNAREEQRAQNRRVEFIVND